LLPEQLIAVRVDWIGTTGDGTLDAGGNASDAGDVLAAVCVVHVHDRFVDGALGAIPDEGINGQIKASEGGGPGRMS
jgi:hypothetical protein